MMSTDESNIKYRIMEEDRLNSVIHFECAGSSTDILDPKLTAILEKLGKKLADKEITGEQYHQYISKLMTGFKDERSFGTALFVKDNDGEHYLITARHVVVDPLETERASRRKKSSFGYDPNAQHPPSLFSNIFCVRREGVDPRIGPSILLMNLRPNPMPPVPCTISTPELDLAIISINKAFRKYLETLLRLGYKPIDIENLASGPSGVGAGIHVVGYPGELVGTPDESLTKSEVNWTSFFISHPISIPGTVSALNKGEPYFHINADVFKGNSGGPVFEGNLVVGIVTEGIRTDAELSNKGFDLDSPAYSSAKIVKGEKLIELIEKHRKLKESVQWMFDR